MLLKIGILIAVACAVREHWSRLEDDSDESRSLRLWLLRGAMVPCLFWAVANLGLFSRFPAIDPEIAVAHSKNAIWWHLWIGSVVAGCGYIFLGWGAITYTWLGLTSARRSGALKEFRQQAALVGIPMYLLAFLLVIREPWTELPVGLLVFFLPLVHSTLNIVDAPAPIPLYGGAIGKLKMGKYEDAEAAVIDELEKKENDFQGWMMLAELYATSYRRLDDAAQVVVDLCNDPTVQEVEISIACNKLADWQLEIGLNPPAARAALDLLIKRLPGSHFAHMAEVRARQLPLTREELLDSKKPKSIRLPALREEFEEPAAPGDPAARNEAVQQANRLTERLRQFPNDFEARERLAIILAEKLGQVDTAISQLRLMIKMPEALGERAAKWLAQIASWERRLNKNEQKFRATLAELMRDYPNSTHAYSARRQLQLIENEAHEKANQAQKPAAPTLRVQMPEA